MEVNVKNADLINHLSQKKAGLYRILMQGHVEEQPENQCLAQKLIRSNYCQKDTSSHNEFILQKRALGEWLGQDDFFAENNGTTGFRRQEAHVLTQLSMKSSRDKSSAMSNGFKKRAVKSRNNSVQSFVTANGNENQKDTDHDREERPR